MSKSKISFQRPQAAALLRRLFELACRYSGQVPSYTKMLGQLQNAGNNDDLKSVRYRCQILPCQFSRPVWYAALRQAALASGCEPGAVP